VAEGQVAHKDKPHEYDDEHNKKIYNIDHSFFHCILQKAQSFTYSHIVHDPKINQQNIET
jgi:hypothetical protein